MIHRFKEKQMAYVLNKEFNYPKSSIAQLMKISPQQMGAWIKEMNYEVRLNNLQNELNQISSQLQALGYYPQQRLNNNVLNIQGL